MSDDGPIGCTVTLACEGWREDISDLAVVDRAVEAALGVAGRTGDAPVELAVVLGDDAFVQAHNRDFRGIDKPTNVLAFPQQDELPSRPASGVEAEPPLELGDVLIAHETVRGEASAGGITVEQHLLHLVVHGVLHLVGFDHDSDAAAEVMEGLEVSALARLKIADPYSRAVAAEGC